MADPAFDYQAEMTLIDQAYYQAGEGEPVFGLRHPDLALLYRQQDQLQKANCPVGGFPTRWSIATRRIASG